MAQLPTILTISRPSDDLFLFSLLRPEDPFAAAGALWPVRVQPEVVNNRIQKIKDAVIRANQDPTDPGINIEPFKSAGRVLYNEIFPADPYVNELRQILSELETPLLISIDDPSVCWELLFDEQKEQFIGLSYDVGRSLRARSVPRRIRAQRSRWNCLIIADPNSDEKDWALPSAVEEAEKLAEWLKKSRKFERIDFLHGTNASFDAVLDLLADTEYDIIHYAGHIILNEDRAEKEYALRLNGRALFGAVSIQRQVRGTPIVFLNGCWAGKARGLTDPQDSAVGMTDAFLAAGAQVVVASPFEIPDEGAGSFAIQFYESILNGKTLGQAMRIARQSVMHESRYAAAWACFVMYGDPSLTIELGGIDADERTFEKMLCETDLERVSFELGTYRLLEQAYEYGHPTGNINSVHLIAAMMGGQNSFLRDRLREQGIPSEKLRAAFQNVFVKINENTGVIAETITLSSNVEKMIQNAVKIAISGGRENVSELDLLTSFVRMGGGGAGDILESLGIHLSSLNPEILIPENSESREPLPAQLIPNKIGPWSKSDVDTQLWHVLLSAAKNAINSGNNGINSLHLFAGMLSSKNGVLTKALARYKIDTRSFLDAIDATPVHNVGATYRDSIQCSPSVLEMFSLATDVASQDYRVKPNEYDLLVAFTRQGGGSAGLLLEKLGIVVESLSSPLFLDNGNLDSSYFEKTASELMTNARICAIREGHTLIGRRHLFYVALKNNVFILPKLIRSFVGDIGRLSEDWLAHNVMIGSEHAVEDYDVPVSPGLIPILCRAKSLAEKRRKKQIKVVHLLLALFSSDDITLHNFLLEYGIPRRQLIAQLEKIDVPETGVWDGGPVGQA